MTNHPIWVKLMEVAGLAILLLTLAWSSLPRAMAQDSPDIIQSPPKIIVRATQTEATASERWLPGRVLAPPDKRTTIIVTYVGDWESAAQTAFQQAVDIWAGWLVSPVPLKIRATWTPLPAEVLGQGSPYALYRNFPNAPQPDTFYPIALANALYGADLNAQVHEVEVEFNSDFSNWYFGLSGTPSPFKFDFVTVALRVLAHGLGVYGSARVLAEEGYWGFSDPPTPTTYDRLVQDGFGQSLLIITNPSTILANRLSGGGGGLFLVGSTIQANTTFTGARLYTPLDWQPDLSYIHLDENTYNQTSEALLTPFLLPGEVARQPGPIILSLFRDLGWRVNTPELQLTQALVSKKLIAGQGLTFTLRVVNIGAAQAEGVILTDTLSGAILSPTWQASPSLSGTTTSSDTAFLWHLPNLEADSSGLITVSGMLSPTLGSGFVLINRATISTIGPELDRTDNTTVSFFGGRSVYLPLILNE